MKKWMFIPIIVLIGMLSVSSCQKEGDTVQITPDFGLLVDGLGQPTRALSLQHPSPLYVNTDYTFTFTTGGIEVRNLSWTLGAGATLVSEGVSSSSAVIKFTQAGVITIQISGQYYNGLNWVAFTNNYPVVANLRTPTMELDYLSELCLGKYTFTFTSGGVEMRNLSWTLGSGAILVSGGTLSPDGISSVAEIKFTQGGTISLRIAGQYNNGLGWQSFSQTYPLTVKNSLPRPVLIGPDSFYEAGPDWNVGAEYRIEWNIENPEDYIYEWETNSDYLDFEISNDGMSVYAFCAYPDRYSVSVNIRDRDNNNYYAGKGIEVLKSNYNNHIRLQVFLWNDENEDCFFELEGGRSWIIPAGDCLWTSSYLEGPVGNHNFSFIASYPSQSLTKHTFSFDHYATGGYLGVDIDYEGVSYVDYYDDITHEPYCWQRGRARLHNLSKLR